MGKVEDAVGKVGPPRSGSSLPPRRCLQGGDLGGSPVEKLWGAPDPRISGGAAAFGVPPGPRSALSPSSAHTQRGSPPAAPGTHPRGVVGEGAWPFDVTTAVICIRAPPPDAVSAGAAGKFAPGRERDGRAQVGGSGPAAEPQRPQTRLGRRPTQE